MSDIDLTRSDTCHLIDYGVHMDVVDALFKSIVWWLEGNDLPWKQSRYVNVFKGPQSRTVTELLFFHYDGPAQQEVGGGGENNYCKLYLYDDHCNITFTGNNTEAFCGINFKYSTRWAETDKKLLQFLHDLLTARLNMIFIAEPHRYKGFDREVEHLKSLVDIMQGVLKGQVIA